jgi:hypothetical protein
MSWGVFSLRDRKMDVAGCVTCNDAMVGGECAATDGSLAVKGSDGETGLDVPYPERFVMRRGGNSPPVRRYRQAIHVGRMALQRAEQIAGRQAA